MLLSYSAIRRAHHDAQQQESGHWSTEKQHPHFPMILTGIINLHGYCGDVHQTAARPLQRTTAHAKRPCAYDSLGQYSVLVSSYHESSCSCPCQSSRHSKWKSYALTVKVTLVSDATLGFRLEALEYPLEWGGGQMMEESKMGTEDKRCFPEHGKPDDRLLVFGWKTKRCVASVLMLGIHRWCLRIPRRCIQWRIAGVETLQ